MAVGNFDPSLKFTLKFEGGFVNNPNDPGGATNLGVTIGTLSTVLGHQATIAEVKALTPETVGPIYRLRYWNVVKADNLPIGVDLAVFDFGVHSGPRNAVKHLQRVLGLSDDGDVGDMTIKNAAKADSKALIKAICADRMAMLKSLKVFKSFAKGLTSRVEQAEAAALSMVG
jgi:lysozyme family protein